jgi:hypothetical protein
MGMPDRHVSDERLDAALGAADPLVPGSLDTASVAQALAELRVSDFRAEEVPDRRGIAVRLRRARVSRRPLALGFAAAAVAIVVSLIGLSRSGVHTTGSTWLVTVTPAQASELDRVAAATAQAAGPGTGQWLYLRYEALVESGVPWKSAYVAYHRTIDTQQWSAGHRMRYRTDTTQFGFDSPKDRTIYLRHRKHFSELNVEGITPGHLLDIAEFRPSSAITPLYAPQEFPDTKIGILNRFKQLVAADDKRLPKLFRSQLKANVASGLFNVLVMLLEQSTSERQRAAALRALAYVRDVRMLGVRKDSQGRAGLAVRWNALSSGSVETMIVNPSNGNLLQVTSKAFLASGHVSTERTVFLDRAVVNSMTASPNGRSVPYHGPAPKPPARTSGR